MALTKVTNSMILGDVINVLDYGADPTGVTNSNTAFIKVAQIITQNNGGTFYIPPGTYIVYDEIFAGQVGLGYAYKNTVPAVSFGDVTGAIHVIGYGATIKWPNGYHVGAFNPVTGASTSPTLPYFGENGGFPGNMVYLYNCSNVVIEGLTFDGNVQNATVGGLWGDTGRQMGANGVSVNSVNNFKIQNCTVINFPTDGIQINNNLFDYNNSILMTKADVDTPCTIENVIADYNGRQGLTVLSAAGLTVINSKFRYTGRAINIGIGQYTTGPAAGVDLEPDQATSQVIKNVSFLNCEFSYNQGVGALVAFAGNGDGPGGSEPVERISFKDSIFIGQYNFAAVFNMPNIYAENCLFIGGTTCNNGLTVGFNWPAYFAGMYFTNCNFTDFSQFSIDNGTIYRSGQIVYFPCLGNPKVYFQTCKIQSIGILPWGDLRGCVLNDTQFVMEGSSLAASSEIGRFENAYLDNIIFQDTAAASGLNYYFYVDASTQIATKIKIVSPNGNIVGPGYVTIYDGKYAATNPVLATLNLTSAFGDPASSFLRTGYSNAAPTTGAWLRGEIIYNNAPSAAGYVGWVCTASGTPGTWRQFGLIT